MNRETLKRLTVGGILWTLILGTASHFFYQWSGECFAVGLIAPVNETVWEHLKLLFFPGLLFILGERIYLGERGRDLFYRRLTGLWAGLASMPLIYYSYTFFTGRNYLWADIGIFLISVLITFLVPWHLKDKMSGLREEKRNKIILLGLLLAFFSVSVIFMR